MRRSFSLLTVLALVTLSLTADARGRRKRRARQRPVPTFRADGSPNIQSAAAIAIDEETGQVLYSRAADEVRSIASLSKLMAALVLVEKGIRLQDTTIITDEDRRVARGGARSRLLVGATFTNDDLLHAALLASDNRAISALGRSVGLDAVAFAQAMTQKARAMDLKKTRFVDPVGLAYENSSTARELLTILREALAHPLLASILKKTSHTVYSMAPIRRAIFYSNTNQLLYRDALTSLGGKTGYNARAGYCFVGLARTVGGRQISGAFLGSYGKMTRFGDFGRVAAWVAKLDSERAVAAGNAPRPATQ